MATEVQWSRVRGSLAGPMGKAARARAKKAATATSVPTAAHDVEEERKGDEDATGQALDLASGTLAADLAALTEMVSLDALAADSGVDASVRVGRQFTRQREAEAEAANRANEAKQINERIQQRRIESEESFQQRRGTLSREEMDDDPSIHITDGQVNRSAKSRGVAKGAAKAAGGVFVTNEKWAALQDALKGEQAENKRLKAQVAELNADVEYLHKRLEAMDSEVDESIRSMPSGWIASDEFGIDGNKRQSRGSRAALKRRAAMAKKNPFLAMADASIRGGRAIMADASLRGGRAWADGSLRGGKASPTGRRRSSGGGPQSVMSSLGMSSLLKSTGGERNGAGLENAPTPEQVQVL